MTAPKPDRDALRRLATEATRATDAHNAVWYSHAVTMHEDEEEVGFAAVGYTFPHDGESEHRDAAMHAAEACARYAENMSPCVVLGLLDELERAEADARNARANVRDERAQVTGVAADRNALKARLARAEEALRAVAAWLGAPFVDRHNSTAPWVGAEHAARRAVEDVLGVRIERPALSPTEPEGGG